MDLDRDTSNIERIGVNYIGAFFEEIGWSFRERQHSDYGIDADVEQKINGKRTNKHIALQIKSGSSYIKTKKNGKISFSIDSWHYDYWLQSDRPVLILLYDPETKQIYWEQVRLAIIQKAKGHKKIEISTSKILNKNCIDELNIIINTYVKHEIYEINENISYELSLEYVQTYTKAVSDLVDQFNDFREKIKEHFVNPNTEILCLQFDVFGMDIKKHIESDYSLLHKACWYLAYLAKIISDEENLILINILDKYINILILQRESWLKTIDYLNQLFHPNIPRKLQRSNKKLIRCIEDYAALIDISIEDFMECKIINENRENGKVKDAEP